MVLWSSKGRIARWPYEIADARKRKVRRSELGKRRRGFKPDVAAGSTRKPGHDHIRLRGVGYRQYRKSVRFSQGGFDYPLTMAIRQNGFTTTRITIPIIKIVGTSLIIR
jgi:hypothetical protein